MNMPLQRLPQPAPARVLACGAFLKNTACLLDGVHVQVSPLHGDLSTPQACAALQHSMAELVGRSAGPIDAVAHDLHPDFHSTLVALHWAERLGVPAVAVQHHHAHIAVLQAEAGCADGEALVGLALDGVGLGDDGSAWGGEVLVVRGARARRVAHMPPLALPGGDIAAREPWRMAAAVLHAAGRGDTIAARFGAAVGRPLADGVRQMLERRLNCPTTTSAGRWFDAAAGLLGLSLRQAEEAEAAIALERAATAWLERHAPPAMPQPSLELLPLVASLADEADAGRGAARFHLALAQGLVQAALEAARSEGTERVALGGGCFFNRLLLKHVTAGLHAAGLQVLLPQRVGCGDAGLALGQAWAAALHVAGSRSAAAMPCSSLLEEA